MTLKLCTVALLCASTALAQEDDAKKGLALFEENCASDGWNGEQCSKAQELLTKALQKDPANEEVELALAQARWNQALAKPKADPQRAQLKQQSIQMFQGLVSKRAHVAKPSRVDARAFYELGMRTTDTPQRLQLLEEAVKTDPQHTEAHRRLADVYVDLGRTDDAVKTYNEGIRARAVKRTSTTAWDGTSQDLREALNDIRFAQTLQRKGKVQEAAKVYDTVLQVTDDEPRTRRCLLFQSVDTRALGGQTPVSGKVAALRPFCANLEGINRAATLEKEGKVDEAIKELEAHQKANPRNEESYLMLQRLYVNKGEAVKATSVTRKFFTLEADKVERCKQFRRLTPRALEALEDSARDKLAQDCGAREP